MSITESSIGADFEPLDAKIIETFKEANKHCKRTDESLPARLFILKALHHKRKLKDLDDPNIEHGWAVEHLNNQKTEIKKIIYEYYEYLFGSPLDEYDPIEILKKMSTKNPEYILDQSKTLWGKSQFLGKNKWVCAEKTFVKPNLCCVEEKKNLTPEEFDDFFKLDSDSISNQQYILIRGGLGSGKTRLLKYLSLKYAEKRKGKHIPIYVDLADLRYIDLTSSNTAIDRFHSLKDYIFHKNGNVCKSEFLEKLFDEGKILILLDGIEIGSDHHDRYVLQQICGFLKDYKECTFIITCRSFPLGDCFVDFQKLEISKWEPEQIERFTKSWVEFNLIRTNEKDKNAPTLTEEQNTLINKRFKELDSHITETIDIPITPLVLSFLLIEFFDNDKVDNNTKTLGTTDTSEIKDTWLFRETLFYIVSYRDNAHTNKSGGIYQNLSPKHREDLLGEIALECLKILKIELSISHLSSFVRRVLAPVTAQNESSFSQNDIERLLQEIECQGGLFNRNQKKDDVFYKFSHKKIRDYFAALAISRKSWEEWDELYQEVSADGSTQTLWMEIFDEARKLLFYRAAQINKFIEENKCLNGKK
jgi:predicted NACHT family NTPase